MSTVTELLESVAAIDDDAADAATTRHAALAKPPNSLGRLEELGAQLAAIAGACPPPVPLSPAAIVAAADHGVHAQGISDWPQDVTTLMVKTMASGGAAVNAIADSVGAGVTVIDAGILAPTPDGAIAAKVRAGTRDITVEPATTNDECTAAILAGAQAAGERISAGADLLVTGEVGIGNTTASACLYAAFTGVDPSDVVGKGANNDHSRTARKVEVVETALARHREHDDPHAPLTTLASLGGLEHAALVGVLLAGAAARVPVIVDGVIAGAAAIAAVEICPDVAGYLIPGHTSAELGGELLAKRLNATPLLDLGMRLGEGTGALLAVPVVQAAARILTNMATLEDVLTSE